MPRLTVTLKQHTPMIHFQVKDERKATLRATELKPKLDRFLTEYAFGWKEGQYQKYLIGDKSKYKKNKEGEGLSPAFNYKVRVENVKNNHPDEIGRNPLFFGNMGSDPDERKKFVTADTLDLTFFCFPEQKEIIDIIEEHIESFFASNNFGTRQNKGFGSFYPLEIKQDGEPVKSCTFDIEKIHADTKIYSFTTGNKPKLYEDIHLFYSLLRSGIHKVNKFKKTTFYCKSLLYKYITEKPNNIENDKKRIKEYYFISVDIYNQIQKSHESHWVKEKIKNDYQLHSWVKLNKQGEEEKKEVYVLNNKVKNQDFQQIKKVLEKYNSSENILTRDLLGLSSNQSWFSYNRSTITKEHKPRNGQESKIDRFPSPIMFKPILSKIKIKTKTTFKTEIGYRVYFWGKQIPTRMLDEIFIIKKDEKAPVEFVTPKIFDICGFLQSAVDSKIEEIVPKEFHNDEGRIFETLTRIMDNINGTKYLHK